VLASNCIATLAVQKHLVEIVDKSDALKLVLDVLHAITPGIVEFAGTAVLYQSDVQMYRQLIAGDSHPACQLAGLHGMMVYLKVEKNIEILSFPEMIASLRVCASSSDAFVYMAAVYILRQLKFPLPNYRDKSVQSAERNILLTHPREWNIDQVCNWVGSQFFKCYRIQFRDGYVTGRVLLALTDDDLKEIGVSSGLHRKSILIAIQTLAEQSSTNSEETSLVPRSLPMQQSRTGADVFISYRRQGGSDFAQLLKVCLKVPLYLYLLFYCNDIFVYDLHS
jgi:hypothetical protein